MYIFYDIPVHRICEDIRFLGEEVWRAVLGLQAKLLPVAERTQPAVPRRSSCRCLQTICVEKVQQNRRCYPPDRGEDPPSGRFQSPRQCGDRPCDGAECGSAEPAEQQPE